MENNMFNELDEVSQEIDESTNNPYPNWIFSEIKSVPREKLQLTTNPSVQIIKNENDTNIIT